MAAPLLFVRTLEQAAAWLELDGQISDGFWENARPYDHWQVWCDAEVRVAVAGQPVGRNFFAAKTSYNFTSPYLLDAVGLRMLGIVRIARACGLAAAGILEHAVDCGTGRIDWMRDANIERVKELRQFNVTAVEVDSALTDGSYTMKHLKAALVDLKKIVKKRI